MEDVTGIVTAIVGALTFIGVLVARWSETNPEKPWYIRLSRVFDPTQIFDSTRKLDD